MATTLPSSIAHDIHQLIHKPFFLVKRTMTFSSTKTPIAHQAQLLNTCPCPYSSSNISSAHTAHAHLIPHRQPFQSGYF
ncbi:hypothetical protein ACLOJK_024528 [Asimina triloba]